MTRNLECRPGADARAPPIARAAHDCGSVGLGQFPVGRIPPHRVAAHGGLGIVLARQNRGSSPCAARPRPNTEKLRIRIDDPGRVHRTSARGTGAACDLSRRPKDQAFRRAITIPRETADDDRPGFAAGTQGRGLSAALAMVHEALDSGLYDDSQFGDEAKRPSLARSLLGTRQSRSLNRSSPANRAFGAPRPPFFISTQLKTSQLAILSS